MFSPCWLRLYARESCLPASILGAQLGLLLLSCRPLRTIIRVSLQDDAAGSSDSHIPLPYAPFSAELLLAVARLGHLERYRQEVAMFHEPGGAADLTRCALLITNIFQPQLDHRYGAALVVPLFLLLALNKSSAQFISRVASNCHQAQQL
jgi:hypothetical protein